MIKKIGALFIKQRTIITLLVVAGLVVEDILEKTIPYSLFQIHPAWGPVGVVIVLAGIGLRSWAAGVLHKNQSLATTGPYALIRHPLYVGSLFIALGFCIITGDLENIIAISCLAVVIYLPKKIYEEKKLAGQYGEAWLAYASKVPAVIPYKLSNWVEAAKGFSFRCWRINREYEALTASLCGLTALQILHCILD